jgi:predicted HicB family RNase H-like nuclease
MNVTLSIDEKLLARARELAHERGTSVNQLVRDYLERLTGTSRPTDVMEHLERL